jgi:hypothetical protein
MRINCITCKLYDSVICVLGISNLHISTIFLLNVGTVPTVRYIFFILYIGYEKNSWVKWLWSSSVIKIVKMKYNRIYIKWWLVSTSFKIYIDILSNFYITFAIFYYKPISRKCTFASCTSYWQTIFIILFSSFWTADRENIIYSRQAANSQSMGLAINISHNSDPTPQGVENRNTLLWFKCVLTTLHVNCMILFDKVL